MFEGHSAAQIITQLHDKIVQLDNLNDQQKSVICEKLAVSYFPEFSWQNAPKNDNILSLRYTAPGQMMPALIHFIALLKKGTTQYYKIWVKV